MYKRGIFLLLLKCIILAITVSFNFLAAKFLGLEQYGLFAIASSILLFSVTLSKFGLEQVVTRFFAVNNVSSDAYTGNFLFLLLSSSIVAFFIYFCGSGLLLKFNEQHELVGLFSFIAVLNVLQTIQAYNAAVLKGLSEAVLYTLLNGFFSFGVALLITLIVKPSTANELLIILVCSTVISCLLSFLAIKARTKYRLVVFKGTMPHIRTVIGPGFNMLLVSLGAIITQQSSTLLLGAHVSLEQVAVFALALKVSFIMSYPLVVSNTINSASFARLYKEKDILALKLLMNDVRKILSFIAIFGLALAILCGEGILKFLGQEFMPMYELLLILMFGQCINLATGSSVNLLIMAGFERIHRRNVLILTTLNVLTLIIFIPIYGVLAAAIITSTFIAIKNIVSAFYVNKLVLKL
ncbi:oligosaccharide flippase family protein [Thalassotalea euphylliae]|uniref:oligosaccharide flippase family protein n=1 Tax=Thalassotalea euphylliae TaxID=1655234 RepID=UPI00362F9DBB